MAWTQLTNNAKTTLSTGCTDVATAITPTAKTTFPDPEDDGSFYATIWDADTYPDPGDDPGMEIVLVTADAAANWTVTRGQAGTAGAAHVAGDAVRLLWLAEHAQEIQDAVDLNSTHRTTVDAISGLVSGNGAGAYSGVARANLTGTANQVTLTGDGSNTLLGTAIQLSLPQDIATDSEPQFGRLGLGQAAAAGTTLGMTETFTQQTGSTMGLNVVATLSPAGALSGTTRLRGLSATARWNSSENGASYGVIYGIEFEAGTADCTGSLSRADANRASVIHYGSGVLGQATGIYSLIRNDDADSEAGDITAGYNYLAACATDKGTGVIGTRYGYYAEDITGGGLCTTQYGLYVASLAGATTNRAVWLAGTGSSNGIWMGTDVVLYRDSANVLKTDDELHIAGSGIVFPAGSATISASASWVKLESTNRVYINYDNPTIPVQVGKSGSNLAATVFGGLTITSTTLPFIPPRMTTTQRDAIASPAAGMVVYNTTTNVLNFYNGSTWGAV